LFAALALRLADSDSSQVHSTTLPRFLKHSQTRHA
jgi:hypothetical protein